MTNVASVLKAEISRVARKEVRGETIGLKKAVAAYRREIAALKRRTQALEQLVRRGSKAATTASDGSAGETVGFGRSQIQCEGTALAAKAPGPLGGRVRTPGRRIGTVRLQLGAGEGATPGEASGCDRGSQDAGKEECGGGDRLSQAPQTSSTTPRRLRRDMRSPKSVAALEDLGRARLSKSFFMRDFLYSEIANLYGKSNIPDEPDLAVANGKRLCEELLEPLNATFGRIAVRSAYRSPTVNAWGTRGNGRTMRATSRDTSGTFRTSAGRVQWHVSWCRGSPTGTRPARTGGRWRTGSTNHLPYSELQFFPKLCAFNIAWHEQPRRAVYSFIKPAIELPHGSPPSEAYAEWFKGFPDLGAGAD